MKKLLSLLIAIMFICLSVSKSIYASETGSKQTHGGVAYSDIANTIDSFIAEREAGLASFAVSVFDENGEIYNGYYGYSDIENSVKADKDTVYEWGSCSKILVWVSVMQQWERGNLDLNKDIREYLPEGFLTKLQYPEEKITMINLMNHNAGFQESFFEKEDGATADDMYDTLEDAVRACECYQAFHVGDHTAYSNWGTALAAFIVERVSGMDYVSYVHKNILEPLGMEKTSVDSRATDNSWVSKKRSELKCYSKNSEGCEEFGEYRCYVMLFPVGAVMSTLEDFSKLGMAFVSEECPLFENNATRDEMLKTTSTYADTDIAKCCHGLWVNRYKVDVIGHGGNTGGCTANLVFDPVSRLGVCCLVNEAGETAFTQGLPGLLYGGITEREEYKNEVITEDRDISGFYTMKRNIVKGAARAGQYTGGLMPLSRNDDGTYSMRLLGMDFGDATLVQLSDNEYVLTGNGENQYMYYKDGILEMSVMDLEQDAENIFGFFASYGFIIFGVLCWAVLFFKLVMFIIRKIMKSDKKYTSEDKMILLQQAIYAVSGIIFAMFILFVGNQNYIFLAISAIMALVLGIVSLANSVLLAYNTHKSGVKGVKKITQYIWAGLGDVYLVFILFMELYNFWAL